MPAYKNTFLSAIWRPFRPAYYSTIIHPLYSTLSIPIHSTIFRTHNYPFNATFNATFSKALSTADYTTDYLSYYATLRNPN